MHANYNNTTMVAWIKWQTIIAATTWCNPVAIGSVSAHGYSGIQCVNANPNVNYTMGEANDGNTVVGHASIFFGQPTAAWGCAAASFLSTGQELGYASWSNPAQDTASGTNTFGTLTYTEATVGWTSSNQGMSTTAASPTNCYVAEYALWNTVLSSTEINLLYRGENPLTIRPGDLKFYYPLRGNLNDYGPEHIALTPKGGAVANFVDHPPVKPPPTFTRLYMGANLLTTGTIAATTKKPSTAFLGVQGDLAMAASKFTATLQASGTQTAGSTTTGSSQGVTTADFITVTGIITNGGTGPTLPGTFTIQTSFDNSTFRDAYFFTAGTTASTTYTFAQGIEPGVQYVRSKFSGNTAQSITVAAEVGYGSW